MHVFVAGAIGSNTSTRSWGWPSRISSKPFPILSKAVYKLYQDLNFLQPLVRDYQFHIDPLLGIQASYWSSHPWIVKKKERSVLHLDHQVYFSIKHKTQRGIQFISISSIRPQEASQCISTQRTIRYSKRGWKGNNKDFPRDLQTRFKAEITYLRIHTAKIWCLWIFVIIRFANLTKIGAAVDTQFLLTYKEVVR